MKNKLMKMQFLLLLTTVVVVQSFAQSNSIKINKEHPRLILSNADIDLCVEMPFPVLTLENSLGESEK